MIEELENFLKAQSKKITDYLFESIEKIVERKSNLEVYEAVGLIPEKKVKEALGVSGTTLKKWHSSGLKRYRPEREDNRKYFYKIEDIQDFMTEDLEDRT